MYVLPQVAILGYYFAITLDHGLLFKHALLLMEIWTYGNTVAIRCVTI